MGHMQEAQRRELQLQEQLQLSASEAFRIWWGVDRRRNPRWTGGTRRCPGERSWAWEGAWRTEGCEVEAWTVLGFGRNAWIYIHFKHFQDRKKWERPGFCSVTPLVDSGFSLLNEWWARKPRD